MAIVQEGYRTADADGLTIGYRRVGSGPPLLLITGFGSSIGLWQEDLIGFLSKHHQVIMYDHRGVGQSALVELRNMSRDNGLEAGLRVDEYEKGLKDDGLEKGLNEELHGDGMNEESKEVHLTICGMADDAAALLAALGITKAHVLGWSMGGLVAEELAIGYPHLVDRLILYSAHCSDSLHPPTAKVIEEICEGPNPPDIEDSLRFICMLFPKDWVERNTRRIRRIFGSPLGNVPVAVLRRQVRAIEGWGGSCDRLDGIGSPTLLVHGEQDILTPPEESRTMADRIPNAKLEIVPGVGHGLMFQEPKLFGELVRSFLSDQDRDHFDS